LERETGLGPAAGGQARDPVPDYMAEQMPELMPKVMDSLMPHMIGDVEPLVTQPLIHYLRSPRR
jgi:hypothetical protein